MSQLTFTVNGIKVRGNSREPLLIQLERAGLQPEYQCRNGMCGACRCKLQAGAVDQQDSMAFVAPNEVLSCCSIPKSDLTVEFAYQLQSSLQGLQANEK
ncbi:(2Fe-2S)-binding protein [Photobacterium aquae]|uniref:(2Fe-2S)-binding protein n=1 Tax=Photobacterium aquae TaxID=1195763 RepID=A0A0J1K3Q4_9GAMM|nr:2Fe-2S iron-sulfur cluster-binding protein [Photobacterium aquae]KLV09042.1 (2Fe-2S)-binding protein [Photobacterium aquae]